jgi:hypothetical protein
MEEIFEQGRSNLDCDNSKQYASIFKIEETIAEEANYVNLKRFELPPLFEEYIIKNIKLMEELSKILPLIESLSARSLKTDKALSVIAGTVDKLDVIHSYITKCSEPIMPDRKLSRKERIRAELEVAIKREMLS